MTEIADRFEMSLNAISKHIKTLEAAGLVTRRTAWPVHYIEVRMEPLSDIDTWFAELRSIWVLRLEALETALKEDDET